MTTTMPRSVVSFSSWAQGRGLESKERVPLARSVSRSRLVNAIEKESLIGDGCTLAEAVEQSLYAACPMRRLATIEREGGWRSRDVPVIDDGNVEGLIVSPGYDSAVPGLEIGKRNIPLFEFTSGLIVVGNALLQDSHGLESLLGGAIGRRIARRQNRSFTVGDTAIEPKGILHFAAAGPTTAAATAIAATEIIELVESVDEEFAEASTAAFMMHRSVYGKICRLLDGDGSHMFRNDQWGELLGKPVVFNPRMPSAIAAGARCVLYGDLSAYRIVEFGELQIQRLTNDYAEKCQTAFIGILLSGGMLVDTPTTPAVKGVVQAA